MYLLFGASISREERCDENALLKGTFAAGYSVSLLGSVRSSETQAQQLVAPE